MRTHEECVQLACRKAAAQRRLNERVLATAFVVACVACVVALIVPLGLAGVSANLDFEQSLSGASIFGDSAGSYVLVALIASIAAVGVTVALMRRKSADELDTKTNQSESDKQT